MFMSLVAIYMSYFSSYVQVQGHLCFPGTFWSLSCKIFNHLNTEMHICHQCDRSLANVRC